MPETVSPTLARRIALGAQGLGSASHVVPSTRQFNVALDRLGLVQLDSVNVFERSHHLPFYARLGAYDRAALDRLLFARAGRYIEYWAHEAAVIPIETWPLMRWRMQRNRAKDLADSSHWMHSNTRMLDWLLAEIADRGPMAASAIEHDANVRRGPWWGWSDVKHGLECLFRWGDLVSGGRTRFERVYALPEQILPDELLGREVSAHDAHVQLLAHSARAHGIGTASDLADYFRLKQGATIPALDELEERGEIVPVTVPGWGRRTWLHRDARRPRRISATALLSPFDPVVWRRERAERVFGFHYRIEIYTPAPKRVFGYYSLPALVDDEIVGRIDLKSDRQRGILRVQSAWREPDARADAAARLAATVRDAAAWQGLTDIEVVDRGSLARDLAGELGVSLHAPSSTGS